MLVQEYGAVFGTLCSSVLALAVCGLVVGSNNCSMVHVSWTDLFVVPPSTPKGSSKNKEGQENLLLWADYLLCGNRNVLKTTSML